MRLGCGHRVVAVAGGEHQRGSVRTQLIARAAGVRSGVRGEPVRKRSRLRAGGNQPPGDVPAALHELEIIERRRLCARGKQRLEHGVRRVVEEQQDVRQLERRLRPDGKPGGHALGHGGLGRADRGARAGRFVISLEVKCEQHPAARRAAAGVALDQHQSLGQGAQRAVLQVVLHGAVDGPGARAVVLREPGLGQRQMQAGGRVADQLRRVRPVGRFGGELVAGDHREPGEVDPRGGKEQLRQPDAVEWHGKDPPKKQ